MNIIKNHSIILDFYKLLSWSFRSLGFYFWVAFCSLAFCFALYGADTPCKWTNIYNDDKEEIITPRALPNRTEDGEVKYEPCDQAIKRRKQAVERARSHQEMNKQLNKTGDGGVDNCQYQPPKTASNPNPSPYKVEVEQIDEQEDGTPIYESCHSAKVKAQKAWIDENYEGHRVDALADIDKFNQQMDDKAMSASEKAQKAAEKQKKTSLIAVAGGIAAGIKGAGCSASCPSGCCSQAPRWYMVSAGLAGAGMLLGMASKNNEGIADEYSAGLLNDTTDDTAGNTSGPTPGPPTPGPPTPGPPTPGPPTPGPPTPGPPTPGPPTPGPGKDQKKPIKVEVGSSNVEIDPNNLKKTLEDHGLKWNHVDKTITTPDGKTYSAGDMDSPEVKAFINGPSGKAFKATMDSIEDQVSKALGDDGDLLADSDSESNGPSMGGGGFAGYGSTGGSGGGAGMFGGGPGRSLAGLGGKGSKEGSTKVAGMSVKRGKDRVGVSQDNIFQIIHRRYQTKRKKQEFIELF